MLMVLDKTSRWLAGATGTKSDRRVGSPSLERELERELRLPRIAHALAQEAVEVKQRRRAEWIHIIFVVEGVEYLNHRNQLHPVAELERPLQAPVEGEKRVVLAQTISTLVLAIHKAGFGGDRLGRMRLHANVSLEAPRQLAIGKEIEFVPLVAIG